MPKTDPKVDERDPEDKLREWVNGDAEVDGSYRKMFADDLKELLARHDRITASFKDLVISILDEPQGIDVLDRLLKRVMVYRAEREKP